MECQTVNADRYISILERFKASLQQIRGETHSQWLMQDGATAHTALASRQWLRENFAERIISLKTDFVWAPYSPDLNPLDFFLWGHLKDCVYRDTPHSIEELKILSFSIPEESMKMLTSVDELLTILDAGLQRAERETGAIWNTFCSFCFVFYCIHE